MGGHGGLNILPQKKWNVYNRDNRSKVDKDKRDAKKRQDDLEYKEHRDQAKERIKNIKKRRDRASVTPSASESPSPKKKTLNDEFKQIQDDKKHVNFFEKEEEQIKKQENIRAQIELEKEFFKDKPFDITTKFMGSYDQDKPWYTKAGDRTSENQGRIKSQIQQFKSQTDTYYAVLDIENKRASGPGSFGLKEEEKLHPQQPKEKEPPKPHSKALDDPKRAEKKRHKELQKLAMELAMALGSDYEEEQKERKKALDRQKSLLRKERMQREKQEREREQKLLATQFPFS